VAQEAQFPQNLGSRRVLPHTINTALNRGYHTSRIRAPLCLPRIRRFNRKSISNPTPQTLDLPRPTATVAARISFTISPIAASEGESSRRKQWRVGGGKTGGAAEGGVDQIVEHAGHHHQARPDGDPS
jgi:hypothetical protein